MTLEQAGWQIPEVRIPLSRTKSLVTLLLLVTFDLDRPTRGVIRVPATPLTDVRASMTLPPTATGPPNP